jgi:hypothetical protein
MAKREALIWSTRDLAMVRKRLRRNKTRRLPTEKDLQKLEREAIREMRRSNADLGVG